MAEGFSPEDTFLSDVHIGTFEVPSDEVGCKSSRGICFCCPWNQERAAVAIIAACGEKLHQ